MLTVFPTFLILLCLLTVPLAAVADALRTDAAAAQNSPPGRDTAVAVLAGDMPAAEAADVSAGTTTAQPQTDIPEDTTQARKVAPHVDLKQVAPVPAPAPEAANTEDDGNAASETPPEPEPSRLPPQPAGTFTLLGTDILPGTSTRLAWTPNIQIAGLSQTTPVLVVNGVHAGPTLCLTAAIHGDELNGIEIVRRVMYDLDPARLTGRVVGIPIVNLPGFHQGSRYLPDRRDLNRHFPGSPDGSLADRIAHSLFTNIINYCDMLVDIHTGSLKRTNLPQLRADMRNPEIAEFTRGFDRMAVVHSPGAPGMLRTAASAAGIRAVTLEAGESHRIQEHQIKAGVNSLTSLMEKEGMISRMFVWGEPEPVYYDSAWIRADHGGILFSQVELGDTVTEGEILGYISDPITNAQYPIRSHTHGRIIGMAVDQVVMAGFAAYHIGTEAETEAE